MRGTRSQRLSAAGFLALVIAIAVTGFAFAAENKLALTGPTRGATYLGTVHSERITVKVSTSGRTATVKLRRIPGFCQGGSGAEVASTRPAAISRKTHAFTAKISFTSEHVKFATASVKGTFYGTVLQGVLKSSFTKAKTCDGQESFEALG